ncbi:MAG TPA: CcmD family protein [Bacteroidia bacterium]|jgi:hypothetical protein|nr:CcmD family protein [Bacteroidia bacterium]
MKKLFTLFLFIFLSVFVSAQNNTPEMADSLRASGKIYVVVCVAAIVMAGLILYLVTIDRKVARMERELKSRNKPS